MSTVIALIHSTVLAMASSLPEGLALLVHPIHTILLRFLLVISRIPSDKVDIDEWWGSWYLTPERHTYELIGFTMYCAITYLLLRAFRERTISKSGDYERSTAVFTTCGIVQVNHTNSDNLLLISDAADSGSSTSSTKGRNETKQRHNAGKQGDGEDSKVPIPSPSGSRIPGNLVPHSQLPEAIVIPMWVTVWISLILVGTTAYKAARPMSLWLFVMPCNLYKLLSVFMCFLYLKIECRRKEARKIAKVRTESESPNITKDIAKLEQRLDVAIQLLVTWQILPITALAFPDARGLDFWGEKEFFFVQHVSDVLFPLVILSYNVNRFRFLLGCSQYVKTESKNEISTTKGTWGRLFSYNFYVAMYVLLFATMLYFGPVGYLIAPAVSMNLNFMLSPPMPMNQFGENYRLVQAFGMHFFFMISRLICYAELKITDQVIGLGLNRLNVT